MLLVQVIMPNDHVMCFKVWSELHSYLTHHHHYDQTDHHYDQTDCHVHNYTQDDDDSSYHGYHDDITDDEQSSLHNITHSSPFTMNAIQQRLQHLLEHPELEEDKLSTASSDQYLANQEKDNDHTSSETDNTDKQNQV